MRCAHALFLAPLLGFAVLPRAEVQDPLLADVAPAAAATADVESLDAIIKALYDVISGPAGDRDWQRMRSLFRPDMARLMPVVAAPDGSAMARNMTVDDYIEMAGPFFANAGFFESEIARKTEQYGHIAHVFSTYESRNSPEDAQPFQRGINSIQAMNDGSRWWILTVMWDSERPGQAIPAKYLPAEPADEAGN